MNLLMKFSIFFLFALLLVLSCANYKKNMTISKQKEKIEFLEIRRLNSDINLKEFTVIRSTKEIKNLYSQLSSGNFSKSAPIPVLESDKEFFLVLKPKIKNILYGDINVETLTTEGSVLNVNYKEIENWEYAERKQSNPIVIIKVFGRPGTIKLNLIK